MVAHLYWQYAGSLLFFTRMKIFSHTGHLTLRECSNFNTITGSTVTVSGHTPVLSARDFVVAKGGGGLSFT